MFPLTSRLKQHSKNMINQSRLSASYILQSDIYFQRKKSYNRSQKLSRQMRKNGLVPLATSNVKLFLIW